MKWVLAVLALLLIGVVLYFLRSKPEGRLRSGQRWSYHTRPTERGSTLVVLAVEPWARGRVVHVRFDDVSVVIPGKETPSTSIGHVPMDEAALSPALVACLESGCDVGNSEGIRLWKEAEGGVFTLPPAEVITEIEAAMAKARPAP